MMTFAQGKSMALSPTLDRKTTLWLGEVWKDCRMCIRSRISTFPEMKNLPRRLARSRAARRATRVSSGLASGASTALETASFGGGSTRGQPPAWIANKARLLAIGLPNVGLVAWATIREDPRGSARIRQDPPGALRIDLREAHGFFAD